jgi:hypothetical protein
MTEKIYLPAQVSYLMPSDLYKVATTLFAFQKEGEVTYSKRNSTYLHLDQAIADQCIQTLIDYKLITPTGQDGGVWKFKINASTIEAAKSQPLTEIPSKPVLRLSEDIKWKQQATTKELSPEEILSQIQTLKQMLMKTVKTEEHNASDGLPW